MDFVGTVWALLPPVIAIVLALITKEVYMSLFRCRNRSSFIYKFQSGWNDRGNF